MQELQKEIKKFLQARKWWPPTPANAAKSIVLEAAELLELFQWSAPSIAALKKDTEKFTAVRKELADIFIYGLQMVESLGLNAEDIIREKMEHNGKKYPAEAVRKNQGAYLKLKAEYRKGQ